MNLDALDRSGKPLAIGLGGQVHHLTPPEQMSPRAIVDALGGNRDDFLRLATAEPLERISVGQVDALREMWRQDHDLPTALEVRRLIDQLQRYGDAIEVDLAFRGVDLRDLWRARRWRQLLNLIDHLPRNSHYIQAIADDRDAARAYLDADPPESEHRERFVDWSPEREALQQVIDRLGAVVTTLIAVNGGTAPRIEPGARPQSQVELLRAERDIAQARSWMDRFAPPDRRLRAAQN